MIKAQVPLPASYSPTIMPLTFSLFLQIAVIWKLHMATMDIKSAYLNAPLPTTADWIVTTLEPHIAEVCGLDPAQEYRIANALYGLPDSGRIFYQHYKAALLAEGYQMSAFGNCLFYRTTATETTYIIVYVDDTFIFSNSAETIDTVIASVGEHYEVILDRDTTSFLGLNLTHNSDGTVTITQPKLLTKLFALYPPRKDTSHKPAHPYTPLPKESDPPTQPADYFAYLRLLGILLYLTKSTGHHGRSFIRRNKEQQPDGPRPQRPLLRCRLPSINTENGAHPPHIYPVRTTPVLRSRCVILASFR